MSAPGVTTRDYEKKDVQAFTAATAPRAAEYGPFPAIVDGVTYLSDGTNANAFPAGWRPAFQSLPMVAYIENCAGFSAVQTVPSGIQAARAEYADPDQSGAYQFAGNNKAPAIIANGGIGSSTLTWTLNTTDYTNLSALNDHAAYATESTYWGAVIQHVDGSYGIYGVGNTSAGGCTVRPRLKKSVSNGIVTNLFEAQGSQHLSFIGTKALAQRIARALPHECYRGKYVYRWNCAATDNTDAYPWSAVSAYPFSRNVYNNTSAVINNTRLDATHLSALTRNSLQVEFRVAGEGILKTIPITGIAKSGCIDFSFAAFANTAPGLPVVEVIYDLGLGTEKTLYRTSNDAGLTRVCVPFGPGQTISVRITGGTGAGVSPNNIFVRIGTITVWDTGEIDGAVLFPRGSRIVWFGDSWGARRGGQIARDLQDELDGCSVTHFSLASQTTAWAVSNVASVLALKPTHVIIEFFVNDYNATGGMTKPQWIANIQSLIATFQNAGIVPVVLMPVPCGSNASVDGLAQYAVGLAEGTQG